MRVVVRVRPSSDCVVQCAPHVSNHIATQHLPEGLEFSSVLGVESTQNEAFQCCGAPMIDAMLDGQQACLFAYGQTGSGKTFSLLGAEGGKNPHKLNGIVPLVVAELFRRFSALEAQGVKCKLSASFIEVVNETVRDLVDAPDRNGNQPVLGMRQTALGAVLVKRGTRQTGAKRVNVESSRTLLGVVEDALQKRVTDANDYHEHSSRSHALLTLTLEKRTGTTSQTTSIMMVDLAGSENYLDTRPHQKINVSLLALGRVLMALAQRQAYVPYRDSVLTRLLQASLGGNSKTLLIATVSPADRSIDETLSTLRFADRAKHVMLRAVTNSAEVGDTLQQQRRRFEARIAKLQQEVYRLRGVLAQRSEPRPEWNDGWARPGPSALDAPLGGGSSGAVLASASNNHALMLENQRLRELLSQRDAELQVERNERQRLAAVMHSALSADRDLHQAMRDAGVSAAQVAPGASFLREYDQPPPPPRDEFNGPQTDTSMGAEGSEEDAVLQEVMAELRLQEEELNRIREEEKQIERMLRTVGAGVPLRRKQREPMPSSRDQWMASPRGMQPPLPGSQNFGSYGPAPPWDPRPVPPGASTPRSRGRSSGGIASRGGDDPRGNPNSKFYDPEFDPHSRFYAGPRAGGAVPPLSDGDVYDAYGVSVPRPPRSAPSQRAADSSPRSPRRGGGIRQGKRGNARTQQRAGGSSSAGVPYTSTEMAAAAALSKTGGATDIGSLYYVLGTQGSARRVKQLHQLLTQQQSHSSNAMLPPAAGA